MKTKNFETGVNKATKISSIILGIFLTTITVGLALPFIVYFIINIFKKRYIFTDDSICIETGIIFKSTSEIKLSKIESIDSKNRLFGKSLVIKGSGGNSINLENIEKFDELKSLLNK
jgi:uncharacterized membrane protein YdbT with pleckstrin-like domain